MKFTNDCYVVLIGTKNFTERYYRDKVGWLKISARGREFRMTPEQFLNHLLPALAGIKPNLIVKIVHRSMVSRAEFGALKGAAVAKGRSLNRGKAGRG